MSLIRLVPRLYLPCQRLTYTIKTSRTLKIYIKYSLDFIAKTSNVANINKFIFINILNIDYSK